MGKVKRAKIKNYSNIFKWAIINRLISIGFIFFKISCIKYWIVKEGTVKDSV